MQKYFLIFDIGGTKTTTVLFNMNGEPVSDFLVTSSVTYSGENAVFHKTVGQGYRTLRESGISKEDVAAIGVAAPGPLDYRTGLIINVPMMGWKNFPLGKLLSEEFNVPVFVDNDGNLGALAEACIGVAKDMHTVLYQTISTGCGGGIAINGEIFHGHSGFAGEFGHVTINAHGIPCGCGGEGCFELYASGTALIRRMKRDMEKGIHSVAFESIAYDPKRINGKILSDAAEQGDAYALSMFREEGYYIGVGIANLLNIFDPDAVVLAGGITKAANWFQGEMMRQIQRNTCFPVEEDRIRFSKMNDRAVAYGACCMVMQKVLHEK
ncbi:MAG: ROK family protein [Bilifractor sp.]